MLGRRSRPGHRGNGYGWVFILNFVSFGAVIGSLLAMRVAELHRHGRAHAAGSLVEGFRYVRGARTLSWC